MRLTTRSYRSVLIALLFAAHAHSAAAQIPGLETSKPTTAEREQPEDPLGRTTPRRTIIAFTQAVDRGDFVSAARYMEVSESQRRNTEQLARELKALLDRSFTQTIISISDSPDGALTDGLPLDREGVGPLTVQGRNLDVGLRRVNDPQSGPIWLITSETLSQVPALYRLLNENWIERVMPRVLVENTLFGITLAHWLVLVASLVIPFLLLIVVVQGASAIAKFALRNSPRRQNVDAWHTRVRWPLIISLALAAQLSLIRLLRLPLTLRLGYARVGLVLMVLAFTWLLRRGLTLAFEEARSLTRGMDYKSTQSLMLLGERLVKALVVLVAVFAILTILGVDTRTALAGVGIGGVALALGAQKTVENLLGGVFLISDKVLAVGDVCTISNRQGVVEDITLRSVRLRTVDQSLLSVPAGVLAQAEIENFATRKKILIQTVLRLRYGTTAEQLQRILGNIGRLLAEDSNLESQTSRIRLVNFGREAIELELFAYVRTTDPARFMEQREKLLLEVAVIVESAGSGFAQPTQFVYMEERVGAEPAPHSERPTMRATSV